MLHAVIMAGGIGARFWPMSRRKRPKQLIDLLGDGPMLRQTADRLKGIVERENIWIVTNAEQRELIAELMPDLSDVKFIVEPVGRNTAPAIGLAAVHLMKQDPDAVMAVLPADHRIGDIDEFQNCLKAAADVVKNSDRLATIGIEPTRPETGYGYIQYDSTEHSVADGIYRVKTFAEKPNLQTAKLFVESGEFFWNSGMFIWRADSILNQIAEFLPLWNSGFRDISDVIGTPEEAEVTSRVFHAQKGISIDYGVMERAPNVVVVRGSFGWSDVGSWDEVWRLHYRDEEGNAARGNSSVVASKNTLVLAKDKFIGVVGVENLIVVDTDDALLICKLDDSQRVRELVDDMEKNGKSIYL